MGKIDVEKWISELKWSEDATDREKTLVAGNIRAFASAIGYYNNVLSIDQLTDRLYEVKSHRDTLINRIRTIQGLAKEGV